MWRIGVSWVICFLQACATGGASPNKGDINLNSTAPEFQSIKNPTYLYQLEATPLTSADPDSKVTTNSDTYDLSRALPDPQGLTYYNNYSQGDWLPTPHLKFWGKRSLPRRASVSTSTIARQPKLEYR